MDEEKRMKRWIVAVLLTVVALSLVAGGSIYYAAQSSTPLSATVKVGGMVAKRLTEEDLKTELTAAWKKIGRTPTVVAQKPEISKPLWAWGVRLDVEATAKQAIEAWKQTGPVEKLIGRPQIEVDAVWSIDSSRFDRALEPLKEHDSQPKNARAVWREGKVVVLPDEIGAVLDVSMAQESLFDELSRVSLDAQPDRIAFDALTVLAQAPIKADQLSHISGVLGSFTTNFPKSQTNRNNNIALASSPLDGLILMPGDKLSYNETVGKRLRSRGYRLAPVIIRGKKEQGIGGGVCQVSSTLFNAAMLADLKIVKRSNHSMAIGYVPMGRDATVTDSGHDLVIENSLDHAIALNVSVGASSLTVRFLGTPEPDKKVVVTTRYLSASPAPTKQTTLATLETGKTKVLEKGASGRRVATYRTVYKNGAKVKHEQICLSVYPASPRVVAVGSKPAPEPQLP